MLNVPMHYDQHYLTSSNHNTMHHSSKSPHLIPYVQNNIMAFFHTGSNLTMKVTNVMILDSSLLNAHLLHFSYNLRINYDTISFNNISSFVVFNFLTLFLINFKLNL